MIYILIILIFNQHTHSIEFQNKTACDIARMGMEQRVKTYSRTAYKGHIFLCTPLGNKS